MEGNKMAHQLSVKGTSVNKLWACSRTFFSVTEITCHDSEMEDPVPTELGAQGEPMIGMLGTCPVRSDKGDPPPDNESPEPGSISLSLGLVEMSGSEGESERSSVGQSAIESRPIQHRKARETDLGEDVAKKPQTDICIGAGDQTHPPSVLLGRFTV